jgi:hypothetical protein
MSKSPAPTTTGLSEETTIFGIVITFLAQLAIHSLMCSFLNGENRTARAGNPIKLELAKVLFMRSRSGLVGLRTWLCALPLAALLRIHGPAVRGDDILARLSL